MKIVLYKSKVILFLNSLEENRGFYKYTNPLKQNIFLIVHKVEDRFYQT